MLTDEDAIDVVVGCIRAVSGVQTVDTTGSLDDAEISNETRVNNLVDRVVNSNQIGVPSKGQRIEASQFENVDSDTIVNALINIVRNQSA